MATRFKVLLSAYACEPGRGSEPEVGWQWAIQLARHHDVTVLTRPRSEPAIAAALALVPEPRPRFEYQDLPRWLRSTARGGWRLQFHYLLWQAWVRWRYRRRLGEFDLLHHVTFSLFRVPGFWWGCPCPVILGPLGGGQVFPRRFLPLLGWRALPELWRSCTVWLGAHSPLVRLSWRGAARILVANRDTLAKVPRVFRPKVLHVRETGVTGAQIVPAPDGPARPDVRLVWVGRLVRTKGLELGLRAFALARAAGARLQFNVVGDGPDRKRLQALVARWQLNDTVRWWGAVAHDRMPQVLSEQDLFLFTSLRDTTGTVIMEAMAAGLPVITLCHQGAAEATTEATAQRIVPQSIDQTVRGLAAAMVTLGNDPALRRQLGLAGQQRARELFDWEQRARQMDLLYRQVVETGDSPRGR